MNSCTILKPLLHHMKFFKRLLYIPFFFASIIDTGYAFDNGDFQIWHTENQEFKLYDTWKLTAEEEFRWGDDASDFFYHHYDGGLVFKANNYLALSINYRQVYEEKNKKFYHEERPHGNILFFYEYQGFSFEDRNRFEYRFLEKITDFWRYRNKFTLKFPWKWTALHVQPYLANEIFVDMGNESGFHRNRFYAGAGMDIIKNVKAEMYYLLQNNKSKGKWTHAHIWGTKVKLTF